MEFNKPVAEIYAVMSYCQLVTIDSDPWNLTELKTKLRGLSPRANYTGRETATCRRS
jgi:hypothetical protein